MQRVRGELALRGVTEMSPDTTLRVLQVCPGFPPDRTGGVENYVQILSKHLQLRNHQVSVLTRLWSRGVEQEGVIQREVPSNQYMAAVWWAAYFRFYSLFHSVDLVHCHGLEGYLVAAQPLLLKPT